jgi:tetratricopeptide (TPR) repeat protein
MGCGFSVRAMTKARSLQAASWISGGASCLLLIGEFLFGPRELPPQSHVLLALLSSLLPALFGYFITGTVLLHAQASWPRSRGIVVQTAGGAGFFLLVFLGWQSSFSPVRKAVEEIDPAPTAGIRIALGQANQGTPQAVGRVATEDEIVQLADDVLAAIEASLSAKDPGGKPLSPQILTEAKVLLMRGDPEQQVVGQIALKNHDRADEIIQKLKKDARVDAFRTLKLEGENWQSAGKLDQASESYLKAIALHPGEIGLRFVAAECMIREALSQSAAGKPVSSLRMRRAIETLEGAQDRLPFGSNTWWNAGNSIEAAWGLMPKEERGDCIRLYLTGCEAALKAYTREAAPADWAKLQNRIGAAWCQAGREGVLGEASDSFRKAVAAYEEALTVFKRETSLVEWGVTQHQIAAALDGLASLKAGMPAARLGQLRGAIEREKAAIVALSDGQYQNYGLHWEAAERLKAYRRDYEEAGGVDFDAIGPAQ